MTVSWYGPGFYENRLPCWQWLAANGLPIQLLPGWLQRVALVNPVTYAIDSMRLLLNGPRAVPESEPGVLLLKTVLILGTIAAVTLTLAVRSFRRSVR